MIDNERILALCELSNDLLFGKIPEDKISYYIDSSLAAGRAAAKEYAGMDIKELYHSNNIQIEYQKEHKGSFGVMLRGQAVMGKDETKVELYSSSIESLANNSYIYGSAPISYDLALNIHLAHEFFHFLEYKSINFVSDQLDTVVIMKIFALQRRAHIKRCSEIAAHGFAKELLQLQYLPNLYDYAYLINTGKMTDTDLTDMMSRMESILG
ncbi:MAG TPA: hypothetical protein GX731_02945 [Clostridiales bacterium]|nr:hypothetical protein [Clostridiales bacterium]